MPRIIVTALSLDIEKVINKTEEIARKVFGENSILPMPKGAVEIVPDPVSCVSLREQVIISIFLHEREERTQEKMEMIAREFKEIDEKTTTVKIIPSPEKLWRRI